MKLKLSNESTERTARIRATIEQKRWCDLGFVLEREVGEDKVSVFSDEERVGKYMTWLEALEYVHMRTRKVLESECIEENQLQADLLEVAKICAENV